MKEIKIIGAGLAGSEAALYFADHGYRVSLYEMRPHKMTEAHETEMCAELVCSNSLKSLRLDTGAGLLKAELKLLGCRLLDIAERCKVPAGQALAVDRLSFATEVSKALVAHPQIEIIRQEVDHLDEAKTLITTGPLTSEALMKELRNIIGDEQLYFFDAIAPIISTDSIDFEKVFSKDRYDKGEPDYLNCAFNKEEYLSFVNALLEGEKHQAHEFEDIFFDKVKFSFYENCMPIEELARRGIDTLRHGVMKPMGLEDPRTGKKPYAVLQLRTENAYFTSYNLVGCQTMLRYSEQKQIFRLIPGLEKAEFLRFGSIHRNSYINAPNVLNPDMSLSAKPNIFIGGQLCGVEGYVESIAFGLISALQIDKGIGNLPEETICGQLQWRLQACDKKRFQPVNANFGLLPDIEDAPRDKKLKKELLSQRSLKALSAFLHIKTLT